ncbi:MBL fold metallo-hydrolase [Salibacterium aidingense]|uniref:MBL fold metallo-hydrolase n=1 Tax=Salibacterium aidingense TaxID=384933 RepID=UPI003BCBB353
MHRWRKLMVISVFLFSFFPSDVFPFSQNQEILDIYFLDAGQGDSSLIVSENGDEAMLIDGGRRESGEKLVQTLKRKGITTLDWVVATHPDIDHIGGLLEVLRKMEVKNVLDSGKTHTTNTYKEYRNIIEEKNIDFHIAEEGEELETDLAEVKILNGYSDSEIRNSSSIVLQFTYGRSTALFTGDATVETEMEMMEEYEVEADVLKVAHHGSATSSSPAFIQAVEPEAAVLPFDRGNSFGHPNAGVVTRLRRAGAVLYSTEDRRIHVEMTKKDWSTNKKPWDGKGKTYPAASPKKDSQVKWPEAPVPLNTAASQELQTLPDIGPLVASNIIEYRRTHGPIQALDDLLEVDGIGQAALKKIEPFIIIDEGRS